MFCSKCGKEIDDVAVICSSCGCPTPNFNRNNSAHPAQNVNPTPNNISRTAFGAMNAPYSPTADTTIPKVRQYISDVNTIFVLSIIGLVLVFGIGFIFTIIALVKNKKIKPIDANIEDPNLVADIQRATKKLSTANMLCILEIVILVVLLPIIFFASMAM